MFFKSKPNKKHPMTGVEELIQRIEMNDADLKYAEFGNMHPLLPDNIERVAKALKKNTHLQTLKITDCVFDERSLALLVKGVENNKFLTQVCLEKFENDSAKMLELLQRVDDHVQRNKAQIASSSQSLHSSQ